MSKSLWFGVLIAGMLATGLGLCLFQPTATAAMDSLPESEGITGRAAALPFAASSAPAEPTPTNQESVSQVLQALVDRWSEVTLQGNSWLHLVTHHIRNKDKLSSLPNGQAIPLNYILDTWYHLDEKGRVLEGITCMRSEDGQLLQVSTFRDNTWRNLTTGEKWAGEIFTPKLDLGFSADAAQAKAWGSFLSRETTTLGGRKVELFRLRDKYEDPVQFEGYAQPALSTERRAYFDPQSGALLMFERILVLTDGTERVVEQVTWVTIQQGEGPPPDVLAFLSQEVTQ